MNRLEVIAMFSSLKALSKNKLYDELDDVIEKTLSAAMNEKPSSQKSEDREDRRDED
jgi:formaldehyde-activating enzyme involved in methanogenesis